VDYGSEGGDGDREVLLLKCHAVLPQNHHGNLAGRPQKKPAAVVAEVGSKGPAGDENIQPGQGELGIMPLRTVSS
jgi:hypothetical protein